MLKVRGLSVWYGSLQALREVDLDLAPGEVLAVVGRNGSGRSSLARALMGMVPASGKMTWKDDQLAGLAVHQVARLGLAYVPETRDVFPLLTVRDNLRLGARGGDFGARLAWVFEIFPQLHARLHQRAGVLSGGEQQMLSLARALMVDPQLLIADEPTEGLAPHLVQRVGQILRQQAQQGAAVLLLEQKLDLSLQLADRVLMLGRGQVVFSGKPDQLQAQESLRRQWLDP